MNIELEQSALNSAVAALKAALTFARDQALRGGKADLAASIDSLTECRLAVTAVRERVTVELFAPAVGGETTSFFSLTAEEEAVN